jgi:hypothetical protein
MGFSTATVSSLSASHSRSPACPLRQFWATGAAVPASGVAAKIAREHLPQSSLEKLIQNEHEHAAVSQQ